MKQVLGDVLLFPGQQFINTLLRSDTYIQKALAQFKGKALAVICSAPPLDMVVAFDDGSIRLIAGDGSSVGLNPDATVRGNAIELLSMLIHGHDQSGKSRVEISGDAEFLLDLQHCIAGLDLRWDDYLAPLFGDVLTQQLAEAGSDLNQWSSKAGANVQRNLKNYLHEEARMVTGRQLAEHFGRDLARLKLSIDRAEARLHRIESQLASKAT